MFIFQIQCSYRNCLFLAHWVFQLVLADCAPPPIPIRIGNVTLPTGATARGLNISVGGPRQSFAFLPRTFNNTFVYDSNGFCKSTLSEVACTTFRGGQYNQLASTSRGAAATNSQPVDAGSYPLLDFVTDNFTLNSNITLADFPIGIVQSVSGEQGYEPQVAMGLGSNSSILNALKASGQIASRSWSMFWGRTGATADTQLDGNFVFGGYDRAKVSGSNYTQALSNSKPGCATSMLVTITDIQLNFPNGTAVSLFEGVSSTAMVACIVPEFPTLMTLPNDTYFTYFASITNANINGRSFGVNFYGSLYMDDSQPIFKGDLTIELSSGLSIRIPNDQLVIPNLTINPQTGQIVANSSETELVINALQPANENDLPILGRQFLSSAYLMLNQDANEFTLWEANPTSNEDLVAVDSQNKVVEEFCTAATTTSQTTTPPQSTSTIIASTPTLTPNQSKFPTGAVAGAAVGALALLAVLAGLLSWFITKKRKDAARKMAGQAYTSAMAQEPQEYADTSAANFPHELYTKPHTTHELYTKPNAPHELYTKPHTPHELHTEANLRGYSESQELPI